MSQKIEATMSAVISIAKKMEEVQALRAVLNDPGTIALASVAEMRVLHASLPDSTDDISETTVSALAATVSTLNINENPVCIIRVDKNSGQEKGYPNPD
jgi:hypothetical protein